MGITESKILLEKLATACSSAERNEENGIQHVLTDKQFVNCLATLWNNLPGPSKDEITGRKRRRKPPKNVKDQQIEISALLKPNLSLWAIEPKSFLNPITHEKPVAELTSPVARFYQELSVAEIRSAGDTIRLRFLKVLFHHLKDRFCVTYLRPNAVNWLATIVAATGLDNGDASKISVKIKNWAYLGGKYDTLCRDIGNYNVAEDCKYLGNLIRLPDDVTDRFILKELKVKGPDRKREVDSLMRRGVYQLNTENDDIDCLADKIFGYMWNQIESCIPRGEIEHGRVFSSLKDWHELHATRVLRLQNLDFRTQIADEEDISDKDNELSTLNQNANARATDGCVTLSPSAQDGENGRMSYHLPGSSGPSSSHGASNLARSDVSNSPESTRGNTLLENALNERDSADELLPEASTSPQLPICQSNSAPEGTQQTEHLLTQSTCTGVEKGLSVPDNGSSTTRIPSTRMYYTQQTNEIVESSPTCRGVDSSSSSLGVFDVILHRDTQDASVIHHKRRRTQATQITSGTQICSISVPADAFSSRKDWRSQPGALTIPLQNEDGGSLQMPGDIDYHNTVHLRHMSQTESVNEGYPSTEGVAQIDPANAIYPSIGGSFQINPMNASYSNMQGVAQIDPANAVYPTMGNSFQFDSANASYPTMQCVAQIDPAHAVYPSMEGSFRFDSVNASHPTMEDMPQIDPANAVYPSMGGSFQFDSVNAGHPTIGDVAQIEPGVGLHLQDREQPLDVGCSRVSLVYT